MLGMHPAPQDFGVRHRGGVRRRPPPAPTVGTAAGYAGYPHSTARPFGSAAALRKRSQDLPHALHPYPRGCTDRPLAPGHNAAALNFLLFHLPEAKHR